MGIREGVDVRAGRRTIASVMKLVRHPDGRSLLAADAAYFERTEAENNLLIGVAMRLRTPTADAWMSTLHDGDALVGAAVRTPPHHVVITAMPDAAIDVLCDTLVAAGHALPGVSGPREVAHRFAEAWNARTRTRTEVVMRQGLYVLTSVLAPRGAPGRLREATDADGALVLAWSRAFNGDAKLPKEQHAAMEASILGMIRAGGTFLWDHDGPVSMAVRGATTLHGGRVTGVYTPPELRGRGYASACTAAVSQRLLDGGWRRCFLFTDLANPTSNKIYESIGYVRLAEYAMLRFVASAQSDLADAESQS